MYIKDSDITDMLARQFLTSFPTYHTLTDAQMLNIAEQRGIFDVSLINVDEGGYVLSSTVKQYLVYWFCMKLFLDKMGVNELALSDMEKYAVKYNLYSELVDKEERKITRYMIEGTVYNIPDQVQSNILFRG